MMNKNITFNLIEHAEKSAKNTALILSDTSMDYQTLNNLVWKVAIVYLIRVYDRAILLAFYKTMNY